MLCQRLLGDLLDKWKAWAGRYAIDERDIHAYLARQYRGSWAFADPSVNTLRWFTEQW